MRGSYRRGLFGMTAPFLFGMTSLILLPLVATIVLAFTRFDPFTPVTFVGSQTLRRILVDPEFQRSIKTTAIFLAIVLPIRVFGAMALALLANGRGGLASGMRLAVYSPTVVPDPATALIWLWIVNPLYGPLGWIVRSFGGTPGPVLLDDRGAIATLVAISAFALGEGFLVLLATRREIPSILYDAALVEGAGKWRLFRGITLPVLAPTMALIAARDLLTSLQNALVPTILLTHGGPVGATKTLPYLIFERGFLESAPADGAAMAFYLFVGAFILVAAVLAGRRISRKRSVA